MKKLFLTFIFCTAGFWAFSQSVGETAYLSRQVKFSDDSGIQNFLPGTAGKIIAIDGNKITLDIDGKIVRGPIADITTDQTAAAQLVEKIKAEKEKITLDIQAKKDRAAENLREQAKIATEEKKIDNSKENRVAALKNQLAILSAERVKIADEIRAKGASNRTPEGRARLAALETVKEKMRQVDNEIRLVQFE